MNFRIGHGYDVHRFGPGDHIRLCGVSIPCQYGFIAHSDGDVALHAVCDALLGAAALGDIGQHFPDTDPEYRNADSRGLLRHVLQLVYEAGYQVGNVDVTIVAQMPRISPHVTAMRESLANCLGVSAAAVNIKATTTEELGFVGRREGVATHAVALLTSDG